VISPRSRSEAAAQRHTRLHAQRWHNDGPTAPLQRHDWRRSDKPGRGPAPTICLVVALSGAAARPAAAAVGRAICASGTGGARASQSSRRPLRGGASSARTARGAQVESAQINRAEGPRRERTLPALSSYRREALKFQSAGKWPGAGRRGKLTEQGPPPSACLSSLRRGIGYWATWRAQYRGVSTSAPMTCFRLTNPRTCRPAPHGPG
jgi:hypothetical protein